MIRAMFNVIKEKAGEASSAFIENNNESPAKIEHMFNSRPLLEQYIDNRQYLFHNMHIYLNRNLIPRDKKNYSK